MVDTACDFSSFHIQIEVVTIPVNSREHIHDIVDCRVSLDFDVKPSIWSSIRWRTLLSLAAATVFMLPAVFAFATGDILFFVCFVSISSTVPLAVFRRLSRGDAECDVLLDGDEDLEDCRVRRGG